jgi:hypothetical protein
MLVTIFINNHCHTHHSQDLGSDYNPHPRRHFLKSSIRASVYPDISMLWSPLFSILLWNLCESLFSWKTAVFPTCPFAIYFAFFIAPKVTRKVLAFFVVYRRWIVALLLSVRTPTIFCQIFSFRKDGFCMGNPSKVTSRVTWVATSEGTWGESSSSHRHSLKLRAIIFRDFLTFSFLG